MNTRIFNLIIPICMIGMVCTSCRGSAGKKVATEAAEYIGTKTRSIGQKANKLGIGDWEHSHPYQSKRRGDQLKNLFQKEKQPTVVSCPDCFGSGVVYATDMYGNILFDYYGNPLRNYCPKCGGHGKVIVNQ